MKIGDLVRYHAMSYRDRPGPGRAALEELGIITAVGKWNNEKPECHVVWFTCNNEGWWNSENLEVLSENR